MVVLENKGSLLTGAFGRAVYPAPTEAYFGTERIALVDMNHDSDPDFVIGSGRGAMIYLGQPGMAFGFDSELSNSTPGFPVSDVVTLDLDGNGTLEMIVACQQASVSTFSLSQRRAAQHRCLAQANVPSGRYLARRPRWRWKTRSRRHR